MPYCTPIGNSSIENLVGLFMGEYYTTGHNMERAGARVQEALDNLVNDIDKASLRKLQVSKCMLTSCVVMICNTHSSKVCVNGVSFS